MSLSKCHKEQIVNFMGEQIKRAVENANLISSAPKACCMLEVLSVIANCAKDFSLINPDGSSKFYRLNTPNSFKASFYQVINEMADAFLINRNSMQKLYNSLHEMPSDLSDIFEAINDGGDDTQETIDDAMKSLKVILNNCIKAAEASVDGCDLALKSLEELAQAVIATQQWKNARFDEAKEEEQIQMKMKEQAEKHLNEIREQCETQQKLVDEAREDYKKKMNQSSDMGYMFQMVLLDCLNGAANAVSSTVSELSHFVGDIPKHILRNAKDSLSNHTYLNKKDFLHAGVEQALLKCMDEIISSDEKLEDDVDAKIGTLKAALDFKLETTTGKALYGKAKDLLSIFQLAKAANPEWKKKYAEVKPGVKLLIDACKSSAETTATKADHEVQMAAIKSQERQTLMQVQQKNIETAQQNAKMQQELAEALRKDRQEADKKLNDTIIAMARLQTEKVELGEILQYLQQGISRTTEVQVAWRHVLTFFNCIKNTVDTTLMLNLKEFVPSENSTNISSSCSKSKHKRLAREATKACVVGNVLMEIAQLYQKISDKYISPTIDKSTLNMSLSQEEAKKLQYQITKNFNKQKHDIENLIENFQNQLSKNVYAQLKSQGFDMNQAVADIRNPLNALN